MIQQLVEYAPPNLQYSGSSYKTSDLLFWDKLGQINLKQLIVKPASLYIRQMLALFIKTAPSVAIVVPVYILCPPIKQLYVSSPQDT